MDDQPPILTLDRYAPPDGTTPLSEARTWIEANAADGGAKCPCCDQFAKVYRRPLNSGMVRSLITMWLAAGRDWQHVPTTVGGRSREEGKLRYWGLVQESAGVRGDGGRAGWWRLTEAGEMFVRRAAQVPRYALIYDGQALKLEGRLVSIDDCLGTKFNYAELMAGTGLATDPGLGSDSEPDSD